MSVAVPFSLNGKTFPIPKKTIALMTGFFDNRPGSYDRPSHRVESSVTDAEFKIFIDFLTNKTIINLTPDNVTAFSQLAKEFAVGSLEKQCSAMAPTVCATATRDAVLSQAVLQRIEDVDHRMSDVEKGLLECEVRLEAYSHELPRIGVFQTEIERFSRVIRICEQSCKNSEASVKFDIQKIWDLVDSNHRQLSEFTTNAVTRVETNLREIDEALDDRIRERANRRFQELHALVAKANASIDGLLTRPLYLPPYPSTPLDGLIQALHRRYPGKLLDAGILEITASSAERSARELVESGNREKWVSEAEESPWIQFTFRDRKIRPTNYSVGSSVEMGLKKWVFEGSNDGENWTVLHKGKKGNDFKANPVCTFATKATLECVAVRLRQIRKNPTPDTMEVSGFEVFGILLE
jgi:hypothetical protein